MYDNAVLYVPIGTGENYKTTDGWRDFVVIKEWNGEGETPIVEKCATPTISYNNGKLTFSCETEGATCHSTITDTDITSYNSNEVELCATYNISVFAAKEGCYNSETATATLCWIDVEPQTEGLINDISNIKVAPIMIQNNGGVLTVQGAEDGTPIHVYTSAGATEGSAISKFGQAQVNTTLRSGSIAIVKIGRKSIKVMMK